MNENTAKLIESLAQKLGTTSEYLWGVLLKQAYVAATVTLIQTILTIAFGVVLYKLHKKFSKKRSTNNSSYSNSLYYKHEEALVIPMIIGALIWTIFFIAAFLCFGDIINGYFNPEYWALEQVLDKIK